jgi:Heterokaryon incompatibility protein (HET)
MELVVVDVNQMCLVTLDGSEVDFITLSYVWGNSQMVKTTKQTFGQFQKPGSLLEAGVSRVIQDAAAVVQGLGKSYLWVDALCIVQDDMEHRLGQIRRMADIYGQSWLTIVSLAGKDSSSPLPGVSHPRLQLVEVVQGMPITGVLSRLSSNAHNQIYEQRAWTFQERLISRRCLYFGEHQVYLDCGYGETNDHEQILPPMDRYRWSLAIELNSLNNMVQHMDKLDICGFHETESFCISQLERYCKIISQYSSRALSFPSDIENAFLGIQDVLCHKLGWTSVAGLPTGVFDWALLWLPHGQLQRREWHIHPDESTVISPPSWSWFGWLGKISYAAYTYHVKLAFKCIHPRIQAFTIEVDGKSFPIHRQHSTIWLTDTLERTKKSLENHWTNSTNSTDSTDPPTYPDAALPRQLALNKIILQFEAEAVSYEPNKLGIEWMNTGPDVGGLKQSLRHGYSKAISDMAAQLDVDSLDLIAMAVCDVITHSMRGGQFAEEKTWDSKDKLVVMLILWKGKLAERLAIGHMDPKRWEEGSPGKKNIRLG